MDLQEGLKAIGLSEGERVITELVSDFQIDIKKDFPEYKKVVDAPDYENHFIWKGNIKELPSFNEIIIAIQDKFGVAPHQIVDFAREQFITENTVISRVATIYQPSREQALKYSKMLKESEKILNHNYSITEQICLVGKP